ncbi:hypothetical protein [Undibacterium sp. CY21W]|nr:hypothetical protein [Undibacterium sp. CY21W]
MITATNQTTLTSSDTFKLPKQKQRFVVEMLETMLAQASANANA